MSLLELLPEGFLFDIDDSSHLDIDNPATNGIDSELALNTWDSQSDCIEELDGKALALLERDDPESFLIDFLETDTVESIACSHLSGMNEINEEKWNHNTNTISIPSLSPFVAIQTTTDNVTLQLNERRYSLSHVIHNVKENANLLSGDRFLEILASPNGPGSFFSMFSPLHPPTRTHLPFVSPEKEKIQYNSQRTFPSDSNSELEDDEIPDIINLFGLLSPHKEGVMTPLTIAIPQKRRKSSIKITFPIGSKNAVNQMYSFLTPTIGAAKTTEEQFSPAIKTDTGKPKKRTNTDTMTAVASGFASGKMNFTYKVPIAPLKRQLPIEISIDPRRGSALSITATGISGTKKISKFNIRPDLSDFKLVQIFHSFCDPLMHTLTQDRFELMLQKHQLRDELNTSQLVSQFYMEAQRAFIAMDLERNGQVTLDGFMNAFQICNRCTEAKRRALGISQSYRGRNDSTNALERQLMEDIPPVIVRVVPRIYEGSKVKSCEHYQWTWCEGFEKTGNEKCRGTNRHDKCPKYLANCTLWKHKLPPKNRKLKHNENVESPSKRIRHFD